MSEPRSRATAADLRDDDIDTELAEFRYAAARYVASPSVGTRYALEMSAAALQILGIDPSTVTPDGIAPLAADPVAP